MKRVVIVCVVAAVCACGTTGGASAAPGEGNRILELGKGTFRIKDITNGAPGVTVAWVYRQNDDVSTSYWAYRKGYWGNDAPSITRPDRKWKWEHRRHPNTNELVHDASDTGRDEFKTWAKGEHPDGSDPNRSDDEDISWKMNNETNW